MSYNIFEDKRGMRILEAIYALEGTDNFPSTCFDISVVTDMQPTEVDGLCKGRLQRFIKQKKPGQYNLSYEAGSYAIKKFFLSFPEIYTWELRYTRAPNTEHHWWWFVHAKDAANALRLFKKHWRELELPDLSNLSSWHKQTGSQYTFKSSNAKVELLRDDFNAESYYVSLAQSEEYLFRAMISNPQTSQRDQDFYRALIDQQPSEKLDAELLAIIDKRIREVNQRIDGLRSEMNQRLENTVT